MRILKGKSAARSIPKALGIGLRALSDWFGRQRRILPWREEPTLYRVWVSEIMLQQTQVATVIPYFERFVEAFPSVETLAGAPEEEVMRLWAGLGYYSRARNLHRAAQMIVKAGAFPQSREGWLEVPGVGEYTAGAILSIALDRPEAILDGNVERVISRLRRVSRRGGDTVYKKRLWRLSRLLVESAAALGLRPSVINQALMELGATFCSPRSPRCELCPIATHCRARASGEAEAYPPRKARKAWVEVREEVDCVVDASGRCQVRQGEIGKWRAGLWDFPAAGDPPPGATLLGTIESRHIVTRHKITRVTRVWLLLQGLAARPRCLGTEVLTARDGSSQEQGGGLELRWIRMREPEVAVGAALRKTVQLVLERFGERLKEGE